MNALHNNEHSPWEASNIPSGGLVGAQAVTPAVFARQQSDVGVLYTLGFLIIVCGRDASVCWEISN